MYKKLLYVFLVIFFLLQIYVVSLQGLPSWDEVVYLSNAKSYIGEVHFQEDFRFPLISLIIAGFWLFTGESVLIAKLLVIFISTANMLVFYHVSKHFLKKDNLALLSTVTLALTAQYLFWATKIYTDILTIFLALLTLLLLIKNTDPKYILLAGFLAGLSFSARFSTLITLAIIGAFFLLNKNYLKNVSSFGAGFFVALLPWFISGLKNHANPLYFVISQHKVLQTYTQFESPMILLQNLFLEYNLALFILILFFFSNLQKKNNYELLLISIILVNLLYFAFFVNLKLPRYLLAISPFIIIALYLQVKAMSKSKLQRNALITFILISVLLTAIPQFNEMHKQTICTSTGAVKESITYLEDITQPGQTIISSIWVYYGYYLNLEAYSFWTNNISELVLSHEPDYFALSTRAGALIDEELTDTHHIELLTRFEDNCGYDVTLYKRVRN